MKTNINNMVKWPCAAFLISYFSFLICACTSDLDQYPHVELTQKDVYTSVDNYRQVMAKLYGSYVMAGQDKGGGNTDIAGSRGFDYMRCYFNLQEVGTDEAAMVWHASDNQTGLSYLNWDVNDVWVFDTYYRIYYTIALCNEFIRNSSESALSGFTAEDQQELRTLRTEARFLRAMSYSHVLDLFREGPFVDENSHVGTYLPPKYTAQQIFDFVVSELNDVATQLPQRPEYPRAGATAAYGILARVLLNAETYGLGSHYDECVTACKAIIAMGYDTLEPRFTRLFSADNDKCTDEILFALSVDNENSVSWGASTYIVCSQSYSAFADKLGVGTQAWGMMRVRSQYPALFEGMENDSRNLFYTTEREAKIRDLSDDSQGYFAMKWSNLYDDGKAPARTTDGVCTDLPMVRLADIYLMMAECYLRGAQNITQTEALTAVNKVRERAYGNSTGNIQASQLTLDFMIQERGREFLYEMLRRTDLVRFGLFTTDKYLWDWKGGMPDGTAVDAKYNVYPIPYAEQTANPNMKQEY